MKGIELTPSQIKAYENGATKFLFPIDIRIDKYSNLIVGDDNLGVCINGTPNFKLCIEKYAPIQKGDKDIFVQEEFIEECPNGICIKKDYELEEWESLEEYGYINKASKMTKEQSRYSFSECIDVKVIRVQDIEWVMGYHFQRFYNRCMEERNINRTYKDNDYVFSVEFKK